MQKKFGLAEKALKKAIALNPKLYLAHARLAGLLSKRKAYGEALKLYEVALPYIQNRPSIQNGLGRCFLHVRDYNRAAVAFEEAIKLSPRDATYRSNLAIVLNRQKKTWREVEQLRLARDEQPGNLKLSERLVTALIVMGYWKEAATELERTLPRKRDISGHHYDLGLCYDRLGRSELASQHYDQAVSLSKNPDAPKLGIGILHEEAQHWGLAIEAFSKQASDHPSGEIYHKLGRSLERNYEWELALENHQRAIRYDPRNSEWLYRLGFVLERLEKWDESADAYASAISLNEKHVPYWLYRCGYVLAKDGRNQEAASVFSAMQPAVISIFSSPVSGIARVGSEGLRVITDKLFANLSADYTNAHANFEYAIAQGRAGDFESSAIHLQRAIDRSDKHQTDWHLMLGASLSRIGRHDEAASAFEDSRIIKRAIGIDTSRSQKDEVISQIADYVEYWETLPIRDDVILYESNLGGSVSCNPYAIFERLVTDPRHADKLHVWSLSDPLKAPTRFKAMKNVAIVRKDSQGYRRHLATAKHLINNSTFPAYFIRRPEQRYLMTWHGTPLKAMGKDIKIPSEFMSHNNTARNFLQATHVISPNKHTSNVLIDRNDIAGLFSGKLAETGYPRIDKTLNATEEQKRLIRSRMKLDEGRPVVVYLPTWRGSMADVNIDHSQLIEDLTALSGNHQIVFRGHHYAESALEGAKLPIAVAPSTLDTYDLLSVADILITDYSSVFFDFLATKTPIIFYTYDREEYESTRGKFYFDIDGLPGPICYTIDDVNAAIDLAVRSRVLHPAHEQYIEQFAVSDDGNATTRTIEFFLHDDDRHVINEYLPSSDNLLFYPGPFNPNGITSSFLNLIKELATTEHNLAISIAPSSIRNNPDNRAKFDEVPDSVHKLGRVGRFSASYEDIWVRSRVESMRSHPSDRLMKKYIGSGQREFLRLYGYSQWKACILFDGYGQMWPNILAGGKIKSTKNLIFLHNDMMGEHVLRFPSLHSLFNLYDQYDGLVSVSDTMADINRRNLASRYAIEPNKFIASPNLIDPDWIREMAANPLDKDISDFIGDRKSFINIARLSPEKDQAKLIAAFAEIVENRPDTCLILVGDGPHKNVLERLILERNLNGHVLLAGQRVNPFPALYRSDCFVLSSNHEGQPMVLLESLTLDKPIIATNIDGNRGVLHRRYGLLVDNSKKGLIDGMLSYLAGEIPKADFDAYKYRREALQKFISIIE